MVPLAHSGEPLHCSYYYILKLLSDRPEKLTNLQSFSECPHFNICHSPPIPMRLHTKIFVYAQTADQQQSYGNFEVRMFKKYREWIAQFIMTLSPSHWVPVQDKGSKILCVKFWTMKIIQSDRLHQEYLTIDLGNTCD